MLLEANVQRRSARWHPSEMQKNSPEQTIYRPLSSNRTKEKARGSDYHAEGRKGESSIRNLNPDISKATTNILRTACSGTTFPRAQPCENVPRYPFNTCPRCTLAQQRRCALRARPARRYWFSTRRSRISRIHRRRACAIRFRFRGIAGSCLPDAGKTREKEGCRGPRDLAMPRSCRWSNPAGGSPIGSRKVARKW